MREIKFRAWFKGLKNIPAYMTEPFGLKDFDGDYFIPDGVSMPDGSFEIMQFTGLKDKNGQEIYEGDILSPDEVVFWDKKHSGFEPFTIADDEGFIFTAGSMEIIGNIYENPELIKKGG